MSTPPSSNDGSPSAQPALKKPRLSGACDVCRRRKIRCDSGKMPGNRCTNCISFCLDCTHTQVTKNLGSTKRYVASLEHRLEKMEKLLERLPPDLESNQDIDDPTDKANAVGPGSLPRNDDDSASETLSGTLRRLTLNAPQQRYFGRSSGFMLVQTVLDLKDDFSGNRNDSKQQIWASKRPEFWTFSPWQISDSEQEQSSYTFPDDDLMLTLVDIYFIQINSFFPLLHRPTFEKSIANGLHRRDHMFGATVLSVCALGSRYSDDPRVFLEGADSPHSCGWKWFGQVQLIRRSFLDRPSLYELQLYSLSVLFTQGSSAPQSSWTDVGIGLRLAQDVGVHRRNVQQKTWTGEDELWKRAFWVLLCIDRALSSFLGRPCAIQDEDFDLDFPIECDDGYWEHQDPEMAFRQPPDKPSAIAFFNCYLKLSDILAYAMRTVYSAKKPKTLSGRVGQHSDQQIIAELDSAMNQWTDSIPEHLRWDPHRENSLFFHQSAVLYASYYHLQILIHRPFIPGPRNPSAVSFPSLTICTNAARSCSHVFDIQSRRCVLPLPLMQISVFTAGVVLLLNIWSRKRSGIASNSYHEMDNVHKCMQMLRVCEQRWHCAGRFWDILFGLASAGDLPLPQLNPMPTNESPRNTDAPITALQASMFTSVEEPRGPSPVPSKNIFPDSLVQEKAALHDHFQNFALPVHGDELGRLSLYGQFNVLGSSESKLPDSHDWYSTLFPADRNANDGAAVGDLGSFRHIAGTKPDDPFNVSEVSSAGMLGPHQVRDGTGLIYSMARDQDQNMQSLLTLGPLPIMDDDTIAMWSTAPTGLDLEDWGTYIHNVDELTRGQNNVPRQF